MNSFFQRTKGSISIFLALVMLPMFTCAGLMVDGARISAAKSTLSGAGDLAMNAALSEYDQMLYELYGIFAVSENMEELSENVSLYFRNSINNSGILSDSDSYSREFINSIFRSLSTPDMEFSNIVDTEVVDFKLTGVPASAVANPVVLERQIVDYMKYRGPLNIGKGLLTKLGCLGETAKQTQAVEAKMEYEKKLDSVQTACNTAYTEINSYIQSVSSGRFKDEASFSTLSSDFEKAKTYIRDMTAYIQAFKDDSLKVETITRQSRITRDIKRYHDKLDATSKNLDTLNHIEELLASDIVLKEVDGEYEWEETDAFSSAFYSKYIAFSPTPKSSALEDEIDIIRNYKAIPSKETIYTYALAYGDYYADLTDAEKTEDYKKKSDAFSKLGNSLYGWSESCKVIRSGWETKAKAKCSQAEVLLFAWENEAKTLCDILDRAVKALDEVAKLAGKLKEDRIKWENMVENLSEGDVKTSMRGDYKNSAEGLNTGAINKLKTILTGNKSILTQVKKRIEEVEFFNKMVSQEGSTPTNPVNYSTYKGKISAGTRVEDNYTNRDISDLSISALRTINETDEDMQFYAYLKRICGAAVSGEETQSKQDAQNLKKVLIDTGNRGANADEIPAELGKGVPASFNDALPADVSAAIESLFTAEGGSNLSFTPQPGEDNQKGNLTGVSNLLTNIGSVLESVRDSVFLEEYMTEMFSCYTDTVEKDGAASAVALNGKSLTDNLYFGAEQEYILWGKPDVHENINITKGTVFGIRFALNTVYAFTSSDTRTPALSAATAIAGWTGFGVPIVQTVILIAWSLAESYMDLTFLCKGEAVALYKNNSTWYLGSGGIKKMLSDNLKEIANPVVDDIFSRLDNMIISGSENVDTQVAQLTNQYVSDTRDSILESVRNAISSPIEKLALQLASTADEYGREAIEDQITEAFEIIRPKGSGIINECIGQAIDYLIDYKKAEIADTLYTIYTRARNGEVYNDAFKLLYDSEKNSGLILDLYNTLTEQLQSTINTYTGALVEDVKNALLDSSKDAKEAIKGYISEFSSSLSGDGTDSASVTTSASGFTMTYQEYLKVFYLMGLVNNKTAMVSRTATLIQANVAKQTGKGDFKITSAYTMVKAEGSIKVRTTFFNIFETTTDSNGSETIDLNYSAIGSDRQTLKYVSVLGY